MTVENFEHTDRIIRQKFENFAPEPPVQVWENVRSAISQNPPPAPSGLMLPILFVVTFLMFTGSMIWNLLSGIPEEVRNDTTFSENYISSGMIPAGPSAVAGQSLREAIHRSFSTPAAVSPAVPKTEPIRVKAPLQPLSVTHGLTRDELPAGSPSGIPSAARGNWKPGLRQAIASGEISVATAVHYNLDRKDVRKLSAYQDYARDKKAAWSLGAYFNPEVTVYGSEDLENTVSYSVGLLPRVTFGHFFLQSGINARFTHDKGNSSVSYNRFLGTYEDVYLVTFDTTGNTVVPTYFTETVRVYDTVDQYTVTETKADYTYLEIPVLLGYRYDFSRIACFVKAGPAASFLVRQHMPVRNPEEDARIINVDYQVPARSGINWQLMIAAGIDYRFSGRVSFSLEPTFRCALKPEYKLSGQDKAGASSFGFRAGLNYTF